MCIKNNYGSTVFGLQLSTRSNSQRCSAKFYGLGCWGWAMVNSDRWEVNTTLQALPEGPGRNLFLWKGTDKEIIKTQLIRFTREGQADNCLIS
jgi:hypothetical protein